MPQKTLDFLDFLMFFIIGDMLVFLSGTIPVQMVSHDFRERTDQEIERGLVLLFFLSCHLMDYLIDMLRDVLWVLGSLENEVSFVPDRIEDDIAFMEKGIPEGIVPDFRPLDIMVIDRDNMPCKNIPIDIYHAVVRDEPDIVVPVEYLVYKIKIEADGIYLKILKRDYGLESERIIVVEERGNEQSEKKRHEYPVDDEERMPVAHEKKLVSLVHVFLEKDLVEIIHGKDAVQLIQAVYIFSTILQMESCECSRRFPGSAGTYRYSYSR